MRNMPFVLIQSYDKRYMDLSASTVERRGSHKWAFGNKLNYKGIQFNPKEFIFT